MTNLIKIGIMLAIVILMVYPLVPFKGKAKKFFPASGLRYDHPDNRKNFPFVILALVEFIVLAVIFGLLDSIAAKVNAIPYVGTLFTNLAKNLNSQVDYVMFTIRLVLVNLLVIYAFIFVKLLLKKITLDTVFGIYRQKRLERKKERERKRKERKEKRKNKKLFGWGKKKPVATDTDDNKDKTDNDNGGSDKDGRRIPDFLHYDQKDDDTDEGKDENKDDGDKNTDDTTDQDPAEKKKHFGPVASFIYGLFFEGDEFEIARPWVIRTRMILQWFIVLIEALYLIFTVTVLISAFFPLPMALYDFLINVLDLGNWYIYPAISLLFLQELVNVFRTPSADMADEDKKKEEEEEKKASKLEARLRKLLGVLSSKFDSEHYLRYYPEAAKREEKEYESDNLTYKSSIKYIRDLMKERTGRVVESYMKCLDASFDDRHVYFASSFYSELGSYLVAYTYIRLLSGARVIYVVTDRSEQATLKTFLSDKLMELTGTSPMNSWRINTSDERIDQADVLIACPGDFRDDNVVAQYPDFFEEATNALFLDADKMILHDSYLCPLMATRLKKASEDRIRFIFLTEDLYKGIAARSLPKFFCADPILAFSSAKENESVSYVLWNRESKSHIIYNESGQKTTCLEYLIADLACKYDIDGVRVITDSSLDHAEYKILTNNKVEVNRLFRDKVDVNYMVYSDERCNLAASIYACTRFRGQRKSVVHIISKPYLLREYFISKAQAENFVNRSSFIQPRVPEHVDDHKLSLFRLYCELICCEDGVPVEEFEKRMRDIITVTTECHNLVASAYCRRMTKDRTPAELSCEELASYLIAGLCDTDIGDEAASETAYAKSAGHRAKEFFLIYDCTAKASRVFGSAGKCIVFNREREIFDSLFLCNERVKLCLNDEIIGHVDCFPLRTHLEYVAGQSILYRNSEYEIEHVSEDGTTLYLRSENVKLSHCLDTVHLRRYKLNALSPIESRTGVLHNTKLNLEEIKVSECIADFVGETYGFYGLSSDKQTLDFYHESGVDGNPHLANPNFRYITEGKILKLELTARIECTDGMRMLLAAVFNEFIRTLFPKTYHAISIVPVLKQSLPFSKENEPQSEIDRIRALYPYLLEPSEEFVETDDKRITLLFINDCHEDVGAFQWFYDLSGRYMQEFLANVYSYLYWLKLRPSKKHYIYFGSDTLPECYDLEGCCKLLEGYNRILSDIGDDDIDTAADDLESELSERCAFCHKVVETGRFSRFDKHRYICSECFEVVDEDEQLAELHREMKEHLSEIYPDLSFGTSEAKFDPVYSLDKGKVLSEYYYRVQLTERSIFVERDNPVVNAKVSLLRGMIELWQADNQLINEYAAAQLYYEELIYLMSIGREESAKWIYEALGEAIRLRVDEISEYTGIFPVSKTEAPVIAENADENEDNGDDDTNSTDNGDDTDSKDGKDVKPEPVPTGKTSFDFMVEHKRSEDDTDDGDNFFGEDDFGGLYNPDKMPRFLKRYLMNKTADDDTEEDVSDAEEGDDTDNNTDTDNGDGTDNKTDTDGGNDVKDKDAPEKKDEKAPEKKKKAGLFARKSPGEKMAPYEPEEDTNPKLRLYNEMVRHAYNYSEEQFDRTGVSDEGIAQVYACVRGDYPELFWLHNYTYWPTAMCLNFRCKDANDKFDVKQVNKKRKEIRSAAKKYTAGISRRTDPYKALLKIYRRFILTTDYDSVGLNAKLDADITKDDALRSLHSALVEHKVVCAGYAAAMQYLMQSIGIVCAYIISETDATNTCHAFNILKLGKYCYYLDATWGDSSNTETGDANADKVEYSYFCVPYDEFTGTHQNQVNMHIPRKSYYPRLEEFAYRNHEFFRYHNAYLRAYNEEEIVRIITEAIQGYKEKEMGEFQIGIRTPSVVDAEIVTSKLLENGNLRRLLNTAAEGIKKKDQKQLIEGSYSVHRSFNGVIYITFN